MAVVINGTTGIDKVQDGSIQTADLAAGAVTAAKVSDQVATGGRRNLIINGDMRISQRATSFTPAGSATVYTLDRQGFYHNMGSYTVEQAADAPAGFINSLKVTVTSAGTIGANTINQIGYAVEGYDTLGLGWDGKGSAKQATASFWVKTSVAGTYTYRIRLSGVGTIVKEYTVNSANTWEYKTITIPACPYTIPNFGNGVGIYIALGLNCGTSFQSTANGAWETPDNYGTTGMTNNFGQTLNATFQITGHQFEVGDTATPFEHRSYVEELAACQRYYQNINLPQEYSDGVSNTVLYRSYPLPTTMRANGTASIFSQISYFQGGSGVNITPSVAAYVDRFWVAATGLGSPAKGFVGGVIALDAEL